VASKEEKIRGVFLLLEQWRDKAVAHGMHMEAGRGRWHGAVRQERPLSGGTVGFNLVRRARGRQVASGRVGPGPIPMELGSVLFKWVGRSQRAGPSDLFLL
jgi:hypothetical protein